ncbi:MAG: hypothetical protein JWM77_2503 [Rhodospirillales bacterium]|nr:hypothetical protein [Rhodospirillales bacterium]
MSLWGAPRDFEGLRLAQATACPYAIAIVGLLVAFLGTAMKRDEMIPPNWAQAAADRGVGLQLRPGMSIAEIEQRLGEPTVRRSNALGQIVEYVFAAPRIDCVIEQDGDATPEHRLIADLLLTVDLDGTLRLLSENPNPFAFDATRLARGSAMRIREATIRAGPGQWVRLPATDRSN